MQTSPSVSVSSFPPLVSTDANARVLILGSMPGKASLAAGRYYAHPRNAFWPIMATLFGIDASADYDTRARTLVNAGVAVWDVLQSCERESSLDADIVENSIVVNDFSAFFTHQRHLRGVFFNGAKAAQSYKKYVLPELATAYQTLPSARLPSTSPAHASLNLAAKLDAWQPVKALLDGLG